MSAATAAENVIEGVFGGVSIEQEIPARPGQLTMKVGGEAVGKELFGSIAVAGKIRCERDLNLGDEVRVQVVSAQGEVIASTGAMVAAPAFFEHRDREGYVIAVERAHKAKVF